MPSPWTIDIERTKNGRPVPCGAGRPLGFESLSRRTMLYFPTGGVSSSLKTAIFRSKLLLPVHHDP